MYSAPKYDSRNRKRRKLTDDILRRLVEILTDKAKKDKKLGSHKQGFGRFIVEQLYQAKGNQLCLLW